MPNVLIFVPSYNCELQIENSLSGASRFLNESCRILHVDNLSGDETFSRAQKFSMSPYFKSIQNPQNLGLGGSFKRAVRMAQANDEWLVVFHGDGQALAEDLGLVLGRLENSDAEIIMGARFHPQSQLRGYSWRREWANRGLNKILSWSTRQPVYDLGSGLVAYRLHDKFKSRAQAVPDHVAFDLELLLAAVKAGEKVDYVPITWVEEGQISTVNDWRVGFQLLTRLLYWTWRRA